MKIVAFFAAFLLFLPSDIQSQQMSSANYSHATWRGILSVPILSEDSRLILFSLTTSWIPGPSHKGVFRYRLSMTPSKELEAKKVPAKAPPYGWAIADAVARLHECTYSLLALDSGGFILQRSPIIFSTIVGDDGTAVSLAANDYFAMDLAQYKDFLAAKPVQSWNIEWSCGSK
jgi:hypothetical protein